MTFVQGDIFDPLTLELAPPLNDAPNTSQPALQSLVSLNPLRGHVSVIYTSSFFHGFYEEKQLKLARALAGLLSPEPGSIIFGSHVGSFEKGNRSNPVGKSMFCHSPESWIELWDGEVFEKGKVRAEAFLEIVDPGQDETFGQIELLIWSVTRL